MMQNEMGLQVKNDLSAFLVVDIIIGPGWLCYSGKRCKT